MKTVNELNINIAANGGTENAQKFADDSNGGSADIPHLLCRGAKTAAQGGGESAPTPTPAEEPFVAVIGTKTYMKLWMQLLKLYRVTKLLRLAKIAR